jgi:molybdopterin converting factor small subunit
MGAKLVELEVQPGSTPTDVYDDLERRQPAMARLREYTTFAVNREVAPADSVLAHGDEVALLQPVSGGEGA